MMNNSAKCMMGIKQITQNHCRRWGLHECELCDMRGRRADVCPPACAGARQRRLLRIVYIM